MSPVPIRTTRLTLIPQTLDEVRGRIAGMEPDQKRELSPEWLARLHAGTADLWSLGFAIARRADSKVVGTCGFKGAPSAEGVVEIAYGLQPEHRGLGYATEAAEALVGYAFSTGQVRVVRAHTFVQANASTRVLTRCGFRSVGEVMDPDDGLVWRWEREND
jgi:RimJ/RimL family protein N-acetyltransferase